MSTFFAFFADQSRSKRVVLAYGMYIPGIYNITRIIRLCGVNCPALWYKPHYEYSSTWPTMLRFTILNYDACSSPTAACNTMFSMLHHLPAIRYPHTTWVWVAAISVVGCIRVYGTTCVLLIESMEPSTKPHRACVDDVLEVFKNGRGDLGQNIGLPNID